jgi:ferritin
LHALAAHFYRQAEEERDHAMRFIKYLLDAGGRVEIPQLPAPQGQFASVAEAVKLSLDQEKMVTGRINHLMESAIKENDFITQNALAWFVNEQLEEVSSMENLLKVVQLAGNNLLFVEEYVARHKAKAETGGPD